MEENPYKPSGAGDPLKPSEAPAPLLALWLVGFGLIACGFVARVVLPKFVPMAGRFEMGEHAFVQFCAYAAGMTIILPALLWQAVGAGRGAIPQLGCFTLLWLAGAFLLSMLVLDSAPP